MKRCPICKSKLEYWNDYLEHILLEEESECIQCGFLEYFGFGLYQVIVGGKYWGWSYKDDWKQKRRYGIEIDVEMCYTRCLWWLGFRCQPRQQERLEQVGLELG